MPPDDNATAGVMPSSLGSRQRAASSSLRVGAFWPWRSAPTTYSATEAAEPGRAAPRVSSVPRDARRAMHNVVPIREVQTVGAPFPHSVAANRTSRDFGGREIFDCRSQESSPPPRMQRFAARQPEVLILTS